MRIKGAQLAWHLAGPMGSRNNILFTPKSHTWVGSCLGCTLTQAIIPKKKQRGDEGVRNEERGSNRDVVLC